MYKVNFSSFDCQGPKQSLEEERQIRCRVYTSLVKCRSSLPVTVKKLYKKSVLHEQNYCFAFFFVVLNAVAVVVVKAPYQLGRLGRTGCLYGK